MLGQDAYPDLSARHRPDPDDDEAYDLVVSVAAGTVDDVSEIAAVLESFVSG